MAEIGRRIMLKRKELGMTQEELAQKMGYKSKSTINKIELGVNDIVQSKVVKFAEVLNCSISYLMGWDEEQIQDLSEKQDLADEYQKEIEEKIQTIIEMNPSSEDMDEIIKYAEFIIKRKEGD